jgi:CRISPR/Cas system-associated exonuclease Cas4 (RecB family)
MDRVIKTYFDHYRGSLPPELVGEVEGKLIPDLDLMNQWRNWRTGLQYFDKERNAVLFGALDDCLVTNDGKYVPLDYKTRGSAPRDGDSERYYQTQLDAYALMLDANGYPVGRNGYLIYYYPDSVGENGAVGFTVKTVEVGVSVRRVERLFGRAVDLLSGPVPASTERCEYCGWFTDRMNADSRPTPSEG